VLDPDVASRYSYVAGNPVNRLDPTGEDFDLLGEVGILGLGLSAGGLVVAIRTGSPIGAGLAVGGLYISVDTLIDNC